MTGRLAAVAVVGLCVLALPAAAYERHVVRPGDRIHGTITQHTRFHEYLVEAPRDAMVRLELPVQKESALQAALGLYTDAYRSVRMAGIAPRTLETLAPLTSSETYRVLVSGVNGTTGDYLLRSRVRPLRRYALRAKAHDLAPPSEIVCGVFADWELDIAVSWVGPDAVKLESVTGPGATALTSDVEARERKRSSRHAGYVATATGDHTVRLAIPPTAKRWALTVILKPPPRFVADIDYRAEQAVAPELALDLAAGPYPSVGVMGESGAGNDIKVVPAGKTPAVVDPVEPTTITALPGANPAIGYQVATGADRTATIAVGSRDAAQRLLELTVDPIASPDGGGRTVLAGVTYDAAGVVTGWTEDRTFDGTGTTHRLEFGGLRRFGSTYTYTVVHTAPGAEPRRYDFLPFQ